MMINDIAHLGLIEENEIELDAAALEIAALDHPEAELDDYVELLEEMTERLLSLAPVTHTPTEQAEALAAVVALEFRFEGDRHTYDNPANADLISVIDRRRGMPIALSILYVALARRVGWTAHALNTPNHVLVSIGEKKPILIDPFNRGAIVSAEQLARLMAPVLSERGELAAEHIAAMPNRSVLVRLLMNQATRAERARKLDRAVAIYERVTTIAPSYSQGWWEAARLQLETGQPGEARDSLSALLETTRDAELRQHANLALAALAT